ncbi:MAG: FAD-dependent thymidylate synthase [Methanobacteriota archaeon]
MRVKLLKYTKGGTELIAKSARVSGVPEDIPDREIVRMIVENDYSSALEHIHFTFDLQDISIALSRELLEHRIASHTARSTRYVEEANFGYFVPKEFQRNKNALKLYNDTIKQIANAYRELRSMKSTRESARYVLPLAAYTNYVWTINARSLINFLGLRLCVRASPEIRELARQVHKIVAKIYPEIFKNLGCRGVNLAACPENGVRDSPQGKLCPYKIKGSKAFIPTKRHVREREW